MKSEWDEEQLNLQQQSPVFWALTGGRLKRASDLTWDAFDRAAKVFGSDPNNYFCRGQSNSLLKLDSELYAVSFYLLGLAIENVARGVLVGRNSGRFNGRGLSHGLSRYVEESDVKISSRQRELLRGLERVIAWVEHSPAPHSSEEWTTEIGDPLPGTELNMISPADKYQIEEVYEILVRTLVEEQKSITEAPC